MLITLFPVSTFRMMPLKKDERVPEKIFKIYAAQKAELTALKDKFGSVISVEQLVEAAK